MHEKIKYIEYACYDYSLNEQETQQNISEAVKLGIHNISVLPYSIPTAKSAIGSQSVKISCPVDFPHGLLDIKSRNFFVGQLCKQKINTIDLFIPTKILSNRKYDKLREDIRSNLDICQENNVELRYILEYRVFSHEVLARVCSILMDFGVKSIIPSSGHMIDDVSDNLIACDYLSTKTGIQTICNGNMYTPKHINAVKNSSIYGVRFHYLNSINLFK
jgi:deoxyribose-phosphate aldolase